MVINYGEPWLMWPDKVSYEINTGKISETFEGQTDFTLAMNLKILTLTNQRRTIFAKLPNYCGIDIDHDNRMILILKTQKEGVEDHLYLSSDIQDLNDRQMLTYRYNKSMGLVDVLLDNRVIIWHKLESNEQLTSGFEPHIIFGSGNFPHNNFNMNFCSYDLDFMLISKSYIEYETLISIKNGGQYDESVVGLYDFTQHTDYKVNDLTNNCNFLHKII